MSENKCPKCGDELEPVPFIGLAHKSRDADPWASLEHEFAEDEKACLRSQLSAANAAREKAERERDAALARAEKAEAACEAFRESCQCCDGAGVVDSGGQNPDGSWINVPCPNCGDVSFRAKPLLSELARLREMVDRLCYHTKDGAQVLPNENGEYPALWYVAQGGKVLCHEPWDKGDISAMYSTREAAEAAREEGAR